MPDNEISRWVSTRVYSSYPVQVATGVAGSEANLLILPIRDKVIYFDTTRGLIA